MKYILTLIMLGASGFAADSSSESESEEASLRRHILFKKALAEGKIPAQEFADKTKLEINPYINKCIGILKRDIVKKFDPLNHDANTKIMDDTLQEISKLHRDSYMDARGEKPIIPIRFEAPENYRREVYVCLFNKYVNIPYRKDAFELIDIFSKYYESIQRMSPTEAKSYSKQLESNVEDTITKYMARYYEIAGKLQDRDMSR